MTRQTLIPKGANRNSKTLKATTEHPTSQRRGGRAKAFEGETVKMALFLPPDLAGTLKAFAAKHHQTPSLVVAEWIQVAEVREAITKGRQAFEKGDVVSHEEAVQKLSKW
jgi:predicted transcriptional regulator